MPRKKPIQGTHDRKVRELARELKQKGYNVQAHISAYEMPDSIGKGAYIPDIIATRGSKTKIIEVDTPGTEDPVQLATFRRSASHRDNAEFEQVITRPRKRNNSFIVFA